MLFKGLRRKRKMIVQEEFLKKLRSAFNLNIYEVKIWTALLSRGLATAGELADVSGVPRSRSYDVLESLEKRGFVIIKLGKPIKYIAVKPEEIMKRVKKSIVKDADYKVNMLSKIRDTTMFQEIELLYKQGIVNVDPSSLSGSIKGRNNIKNQISSLLDEAESTVTIMTTPTSLVRKHDEFKNKFKKLKTKGVRIRVATQVTDEIKNTLKELEKVAEVKHVEGLSGRFVIVDGKQLVFMIESDKNIHESYDTGIWVKTPYFASAMEQMFDAAWSTLK